MLQKLCLSAVSLHSHQHHGGNFLRISPGFFRIEEFVPVAAGPYASKGKWAALGKLLTKQKCDCSEVVSVHEATFFLAELVKANNIIIDFGHALASGSAVSVFAICSHWTGTAQRTQGNCFKSQLSLRTRCQSYNVHDVFCPPQKVGFVCQAK